MEIFKFTLAMKSSFRTNYRPKILRKNWVKTQYTTQYLKSIVKILCKNTILSQYFSGIVKVLCFFTILSQYLNGPITILLCCRFGYCNTNTIQYNTCIAKYCNTNFQVLCPKPSSLVAFDNV